MTGIIVVALIGKASTNEPSRLADQLVSRVRPRMRYYLAASSDRQREEPDR